MAATVFVDGVTVIIAAWLNDVDSVTYDNFGNGSAYTGILTVADTTQATSITTGSSKNAGGTSIQKALWVGGLINTASTLSVGGDTTLTGVAGTGGNGYVIGPSVAGKLLISQLGNATSQYDLRSAAGSSLLNVTNAGAVTISGTLALSALGAGTALTVGALDSGGVGYRMMRVAN